MVWTGLIIITILLESDPCNPRTSTGILRTIETHIWIRYAEKLFTQMSEKI
jgi:hypothetical protein